MIKRHSLKIDYVLLATVIVLVLIGSVVVYSASYYDLEIGFREDGASYYQSMLLFSVIGVAAMIIISFIPYELLKKGSILFLIIAVTIASLFVVMAFGEEIKGAKRWIRVGSFTFMPAELAKVSLIFFISFYIDRVGTKIKQFKVFGLLLVSVLIMVALVYPQRDLATIMLLVILAITMMFVGGAKISNLLSLIPLGGIAFLIMAFKESYRGSRLKIWRETIFDRVYEFSDAKRQLMNSIYAVSSGGVRGKGIGMSEFSNLRLPDAYSDFIFAVFAEEFGFIGSLILLALYSFLVYRIFKIAMDCEDLFGFLVASGTGLVISLQVIINVGVALAILPTTGIPLPFISKGGTSIIITLMLMGVVLNISSKNSEKVSPIKQ